MAGLPPARWWRGEWRQASPAFLASNRSGGCLAVVGSAEGFRLPRLCSRLGDRITCRRMSGRRSRLSGRLKAANFLFFIFFNSCRHSLTRGCRAFACPTALTCHAHPPCTHCFHHARPQRQRESPGHRSEKKITCSFAARKKNHLVANAGSKPRTCVPPISRTIRGLVHTHVVSSSRPQSFDARYRRYTALRFTPRHSARTPATVLLTTPA